MLKWAQLHLVEGPVPALLHHGYRPQRHQLFKLGAKGYAIHEHDILVPAPFSDGYVRQVLDVNAWVLEVLCPSREPFPRRPHAMSVCASACWVHKAVPPTQAAIQLWGAQLPRGICEVGVNVLQEALGIVELIQLPAMGQRGHLGVGWGVFEVGGEVRLQSGEGWCVFRAGGEVCHTGTRMFGFSKLLQYLN